MEEAILLIGLAVFVWCLLRKLDGYRKRELTEEMRKIFLGTIRDDPEAPPMERNLKSICLAVKERQQDDVYAFLEERIADGTLDRRPDPLGRQQADFYFLTRKGLDLLRQSKDTETV